MPSPRGRAATVGQPGKRTGLQRCRILREILIMQKQYVMVVPVPKEGPNGDRDTQRHPYFDYEVHLLSEGEPVGPSTLVHEVSGFDDWHTHIKPAAGVRSDAQKYAEKLAQRIKTEVRWAGEGCDVWTVVMKVQLLAKDAAQALELFESRRASGEVKPHVYKKRTR